MRIAPNELTAFCTAVFAAAGVAQADAALMARILVDADLRGLGTHGVSRLPVYVACLRSGRMAAAPDIRLERVAPALGRVHGGNGLGLLVAERSMRFAMNIAAEAGSGFVAVRASSHCGVASYYCRMAAREGKIGLAFTNAPSAMPPWGGRTPYFGTNPIAVAFPGPDGEDVVVDLSTSVTARGRIIQAKREGKPIPEGWAVDAEGRPTTDPAKALDGAVLPMAGPKGYALALVVELFAAVLSGAAWGTSVGWMYDDSTKPVDIGHAFMAIDVAPLMHLPHFLERVRALVEDIKAQPLAEGVSAIQIPGERGRRSVRERAAEGIPLTDAVRAELDACAALVGVPPLAG